MVGLRFYHSLYQLFNHKANVSIDHHLSIFTCKSLMCFVGDDCTRGHEELGTVAGIFKYVNKTHAYARQPSK